MRTIPLKSIDIEICLYNQNPHFGRLNTLAPESQAIFHNKSARKGGGRGVEIEVAPFPSPRKTLLQQSTRVVLVQFFLFSTNVKCNLPSS